MPGWARWDRWLRSSRWGGGVVFYKITGQVNDASGSGLDGVTVTLTGDASDSVVTAGGGLYEFAGLNPGSYTVTPTKAGYTFDPTSAAVTIVGTNKVATTMAAVWKIAGTILDGTDPIEWLLLTNLSIDTAEQAGEKIAWYLGRWQVEIYFRILKSGCKVEKLQLEKLERLEPALAFYMIIAWRVLYLTMLGRECPELPCNVVFADEEWQAVYIVAKRQKPPEKPPSLDTMVRMAAGFGGFLNRKGDGFPGPPTLWIGLQRGRDFAIAIATTKALE